MGSFSIWHWLIVLLVVVMIFGTKKLSNVGSDLGSAIKNFRKAVKEGEEENSGEQHAQAPAPTGHIEEKARPVIEGQASREKDRA